MCRADSRPLRRERHRCPELLALIEGDLPRYSGPYGIDPGWHHTCDYVTGPIQRDRFVDDPRITAITALPESMSQDNDLAFARLVLLRKKRAAQHRLNAHDREISGASQRALQLFWFTITR